LSPLLLLAPLACSSSEDAGGNPSTTAGSGGEAGFPRTISTGPGDVTIESRPERVVTLGNVDADIVTALGVVPVAVIENQSFESGMSPWLETALGEDADDLEVIAASDGAPLESIAAADPDLIIAGSAAFDVDAVYEQLNQIAPTVTYLEGPFDDSWSDRTQLVGEALGLDAEADDLVDATESDLAALGTEHPDWDGRTVVFGFNFNPTTIRLLTAPTDGTVSFLNETFGLVVPPDVEALGDDLNGTADISQELLGVMDADVLLLAFMSDSLRSEMEANPLFATLPVVQRSAYEPLDLATATALRETSVLSIPYAVSVIEPALVRALGA
jgi:iron complex transport system substrate-binding protein